MKLQVGLAATRHSGSSRETLWFLSILGASKAARTDAGDCHVSSAAAKKEKVVWWKVSVLHENPPADPQVCADRKKVTVRRPTDLRLTARGLPRGG